jgi:hypothetical protein
VRASLGVVLPVFALLALDGKELLGSILSCVVFLFFFWNRVLRPLVLRTCCRLDLLGLVSDRFGCLSDARLCSAFFFSLVDHLKPDVCPRCSSSVLARCLHQWNLARHNVFFWNDVFGKCYPNLSV